MSDAVKKTTQDYSQTDLGKMSNWVLKFGKHKGKTFGDLLTKERDYCSWITRNFEETDALYQFIVRSELDDEPAPVTPESE